MPNCKPHSNKLPSESFEVDYDKPTSPDSPGGPSQTVVLSQLTPPLRPRPELAYRSRDRRPIRRCAARPAERLLRSGYTTRTKCAISYAASEIALLRCYVFADSRLRKNAMVCLRWHGTGLNSTDAYVCCRRLRNLGKYAIKFNILNFFPRTRTS